MTDPSAVNPVTQADRERARGWRNALRVSIAPDGIMQAEIETEVLAAEFAAVRSEGYQAGLDRAATLYANIRAEGREEGARGMRERCKLIAHGAKAWIFGDSRPEIVADEIAKSIDALPLSEPDNP